MYSIKLKYFEQFQAFGFTGSTCQFAYLKKKTIDRFYKNFLFLEKKRIYLDLPFLKN